MKLPHISYNVIIIILLYLYLYVQSCHFNKNISIKIKFMGVETRLDRRLAKLIFTMINNNNDVVNDVVKSITIFKLSGPIALY